MALVASRESKKTALEYTAFLRPDGAVVVVVLNRWVMQPSLPCGTPILSALCGTPPHWVQVLSV